MHKVNITVSESGQGERASFWSAVTRHRFDRLADLSTLRSNATEDGSARQSRDQRLVNNPYVHVFDGDKSPAESADKSAHSKALPDAFRITLAVLAVLLAATLAPASWAAEKGSDTIRVLFLGDRGHHRPAERFAQLQPVLTPRNIELTYTEAMTNLNSAYLAQFDALLIYANTTRISPDQEKSMMDFVAAGGGLAPIHCASYCFLNSSNYVELVGAQFRRHGTGTFKETIIKADHPVMTGLSAIESWDETYVHHRHNTNRIVLAERRDTSGAEPWTWVREHGRGRVFYTAWGHDQRTWSNAGFHALVENGVRWASANSPNQLKRKN